MANLRVTLFNFLIRHTVKRRLKACKSPLDVRAVFESARVFTPKGVTFRPGRVGGVAGEWAEAGAAPKGTLLYIHGGGYVAMSPKTHRAITGGFALRGFRVFAVDYRLAPEHVFPAGLDDATNAWRALRAETTGPMYVAGDSAGGGLTLALLLNLRDLAIPGPDAACVFSPWTDLAATGASAVTNRERDPLLSFDRVDVLVKSYAGETDPRFPLVSPLYGDYRGIAPLIAFVGSTEILLDDSTRLAERARAAGVRVELKIYPDMPHVWPAAHAILREGRQALDEAAAFMGGRA